ncbi:hypothetical protein SDSG_00027 [Ruegeria phage DSS3-P1]|nr:hypothetical protein SDSG_00027 [Ruegeria phage DSS3-P1]
MRQIHNVGSKWPLYVRKCADRGIVPPGIRGSAHTGRGGGPHQGSLADDLAARSGRLDADQPPRQEDARQPINRPGKKMPGSRGVQKPWKIFPRTRREDTRLRVGTLEHHWNTKNQF